jgi:hypothetical protein
MPSLQGSKGSARRFSSGRSDGGFRFQHSGAGSTVTEVDSRPLHFPNLPNGEHAAAHQSPTFMGFPAPLGFDTAQAFQALNGIGVIGNWRGSMLLEILDGALMLLCFLKRVERAEIASFSCRFALLSRIQTIFAGFEFTDHK